MEGSDGSPPPSLCMIRAAELFPKPTMEKEDNELVVPFHELPGESVKYLGHTDDGVLALSNYRLFLLKNPTCSETSVPLGLIEFAQTRDLFILIINCKDASTVKCSFETAEQCSEWQRRITLSVGVPEVLESLFAFPFYSWTSDSISVSDNQDLTRRLQRSTRYEDDFRKEVERLQFDLNGTWRISQANVDFKLCPSYPQMILVPCCISDETLQNVANFRGSRRLPAVVWRHKKSGAVIARCSQPEVGWLGWRNSKDEQLLKALADACAFDRGEQNRRMNLCTSGDSTPSSPDGSHEEVILDEVRKILIVDARSYTSAVTNRARGGGCECIEYYPCAEIEFMNLGNIHVIRKSFHALRQLCASPPDVPNWLTLLEKTMWLQHLSGLLAASVTVCIAIEKKGRPVLVHCSDGWDRTPQIVATSQLCLDPYYRTVEGFRILVEREWLQFGHKFADRCGHGPGSDDPNERCPVFLQWLDLVHQIHRQYPCSFEFSMGYLIKLAQHSHSCLFGTFLGNTLKERLQNSVFERSFSVWQFLSGPMYRNPLYIRNKEKVLWPAYNVRDLYLWTEVYLGSLGNQNVADFPTISNEGSQETTNLMTKTRSYGDLVTGVHQNGFSRRSSDPNMTAESKIGEKSFGDFTASTIDMKSSTNIIATIHDTTEKLQNLTNELNHTDDEPLSDINNELLQCESELISVFQSVNANDSKVDVNSCVVGSNDEHKGCDLFSDRTKKNNTFLNEVRKNGASGMECDTVDSGGVQHHSDIMESINLNTDSKTTSLTNEIEVADHCHGSNTTSADILVPVHMKNTPNTQKEPKGDINNENQIIASKIQEQCDVMNKLYDCDTSQAEEMMNSPEVLYKPTFQTYLNPNNSTNQMDESILVLPEYQKLEISTSGKCDRVVGNIVQTGSSSHRRRRTSSSNSKTDFLSLKNLNACNTTSRFSMPGVRSLPLTPPGVSEKQQIAISCPDGLAHALSEQNIRLQQIVYEHKVREDALLRELHGMRLALLKKTCPNCNNVTNPNHDEHASTLDNLENASVCSWEAVDDKSAPSSCGSSIQTIGGGALWVPDHAVSRCTICQTEFWLGRRKHHCRQCGQIFCADCSEFWAPLPDERLYNPVRLCGPCYHSVTTRIQATSQSATTLSDNNRVMECTMSAQSLVAPIEIVSIKPTSPNHTPMLSATSSIAMKNNTASITTSSTPSLEACKHAATPPRNEHNRLKATTASN